eukprot:GILJ01011350.1.p1 GENE.GILJ01011350.1~~GILJ01011350.1.p1  ORF type:complete len:1306 (+),score=226.14 GILJ01011350.1:105-4022(+)
MDDHAHHDDTDGVGGQDGMMSAGDVTVQGDGPVFQPLDDTLPSSPMTHGGQPHSPLLALPAPEPVPSNDVANHVWRISNFSKLGDAKVYSDTFEAQCKWHVMLFPRGNSNKRFVAVYLEPLEHRNWPHTWSKHVQFQFKLINHIDPVKSIVKDATNRFSIEHPDWGFAELVSIDEVLDPSLGFLQDDAITIESSVKEIVQFWTGAIDSKKETGFVGLKNQGATCYLNSLIQTLYCLAPLRQAVYSLPTDNEEISSSIPLALQKLFYKLHSSEKSVGTKALTKSFGWNSYEAFTQHDVQELNRLLCDKLEEKMKNTVAEGAINRLFEGKTVNFVRCLDVDYRSTREESFYDIQLNVKGCNNVEESFEKYTELETLDEENKYEAEGHGKQRAERGTRFKQFPPVLSLQLKRFQYDYQKEDMAKVNDRYEFPQVLQLDRFLAEDAVNQVPNTYHLYSVLVHSGDVHGGHYFAFIRPFPPASLLGGTPHPAQKSEWLRFDDERVSKATASSAIQDNFGGPETHAFGKNFTNSFNRMSNAYMLVYIRESDITSILAPASESDVPDNLLLRFQRDDMEEAARKEEKRQAHLYMTIKMFTEKDLRAHHGPNLVDLNLLHPSRVLKDETYQQLGQRIENELGFPTQCLRFWPMVCRENKTVRPDVLTSQDVNIPFAQHARTAQNNQPRCFLEVSDPLIFDKLTRLAEASCQLNAQAMARPCPSPDAALFSSQKDTTTDEPELKTELKTEPFDEPMTGVNGLNGLDHNNNGSSIQQMMLQIEQDRDQCIQQLKPLPPLEEDSALIFIKWYDAVSMTLSFLAFRLFSTSKSLRSVQKFVNHLRQAPLDEELVMFEEVKPTSVEALSDLTRTLKQCEIGTGDIIVCQLPQSSATNGVLYPTAVSYYQYLQQRITVTVRNKLQPTESFELELTKNMPMLEVVSRLSKSLQVDPDYLLLIPSSSNDQPITLYPTATLPQKRCKDLQHFLSEGYGTGSATLFYEIVDFEVAELEYKRSIKVSLFDDSVRLLKQYTILVPKTALFQNVYEEAEKAILKDTDVAYQFMEPVEEFTTAKPSDPTESTASTAVESNGPPSNDNGLPVFESPLVEMEIEVDVSSKLSTSKRSSDNPSDNLDTRSPKRQKTEGEDETVVNGNGNGYINGGTRRLRQLRALDITSNKINKVYKPSDTVYSGGTELRIEFVSPDEADVAPEKLMAFVHVPKVSAYPNPFGDPFVMAVPVDQTVAELRERIREKLKLSKEEIARWKIGSFLYSKASAVAEDDKIWEKLTIPTYYLPQVALEHSDPSNKLRANRALTLN